MPAQQQIEPTYRVQQPLAGKKRSSCAADQLVRAALREVLPVAMIMTLICGLAVPIMYYLTLCFPSLGLLRVSFGALLIAGVETIVFFASIHLVVAILLPNVTSSEQRGAF